MTKEILKNKTVLQPVLTCLYFSGEVLEMLDIRRLYDGEYVCNADNGVGHKPVRQSITLKVLCKYLCEQIYQFFSWAKAPALYVTMSQGEEEEVEVGHF